MKEQNNIGMKILSVVMGALLGGMIWRCRGESGWGSSWGLYAVGLVLLLLIYTFYGKKQGFTAEKLLFGSLLTGLGVTGYATVLQQPGGVVESDLPYQGQVVQMPINPWSGVLIMFLMGFTLVPLFSMFVGTLFSKKQIPIYHYFIMIGIFFGVQLLAKATFAPYLLSVINPEQTEWAYKGLLDSGYTEYQNAIQAYMAHFMNRRWTQTVPFFENFYMSVEHIGDFFASLCVSLYPAVILKEKRSTVISLVINIFTGINTTAASFLLYLNAENGIYSWVKVTDLMRNMSGWGIWEFCTGAGVGFITMLCLCFLPKQRTLQTTWDNTPAFSKKIHGFVFNLGLFVFILAVAPMRVIGMRTARVLETEGILADRSPTEEIIMAVGIAALSIYYLVTIVKNTFKKGKVGMDCDTGKLVHILFPSYLALMFAGYFFGNHGYLFNLPYSEFADLGLFGFLTNFRCFEVTLMMLAFILFISAYILLRKQLKKMGEATE